MHLLKIITLIICMSLLSLNGCGGGGGGGTSTVPTVKSFTMPSNATSLTVEVTTFTASDASGYLITESATVPAANASGWTSSVPSSFTFTTAGKVTAYAWVKDATGNVSLSFSAAVDISSVTLVLSTTSTSAVNNIGLILLTEQLPPGVSLSTDVNGNLLSNVVQLSGVLNGVVNDYPSPPIYNNAARTIQIGVADTIGFGLGKFLTISCNVAEGFNPSLADFSLLSPAQVYLSPSGSPASGVSVISTLM